MNQIVKVAAIFFIGVNFAQALPAPTGKTVSFMPAANLRIKPIQGFVFPLMAPRISSSFGLRIHPIRRYSKQHQGIDLAAPKDSIIRAVAAGTIIFADRHAGLGNLVVISHSNKFVTRYGHCSQINVRPGQKIKAGQIIALVGSTGTSTGPHLHLETLIDGKAYDPEKLLPGLAEEGDG